MRTISLSQGLVALVDDADYEWLSKFTWHAARRGLKVYAARNPSIGVSYMHREILCGPEIDHIDGNTLNNSRSNLRVANKSQNQANANKRRGCRSKFKGVCWHKQREKWSASCKKNYRKMSLGLFHSEVEAAKAYDRAALLFFGEFALTNERLGLFK